MKSTEVQNPRHCCSAPGRTMVRIPTAVLHDSKYEAEAQPKSLPHHLPSSFLFTKAHKELLLRKICACAIKSPRKSDELRLLLASRRCLCVQMV